MNVLLLSRFQFAATAMFHFIFVPLTLGLSVLLAIMETMYVRTGHTVYLRMTRFWGRLFIINFVLGVVTGITLEFQFGMNWAEYSKYVGDIFGVPLAIEATVAFFLESVFMGLWVFGWNKVSKKVHAVSIWFVAIGTNLSALWILLANGWMQHPVGYVIKNNRAEMVDFMAMATNKNGLLEFFHTVSSSYVLAAFFLMGVSAYHLLRKNEPGLFKTSFRIASVFGLISSLVLLGIGDSQASNVAKTQPAKFAAMESVWQTEKPAAYNLLIVPDEKEEKNVVEAWRIPGLLSLMAFHDRDAEVKGLKDFPKDDRPPVLPVFLSFRIMVGLGMLFILLSFISVILSERDLLERNAWFLTVMFWATPLPYLAVQLGWILTELGRQPWIVYGMLKTSAGLSTSLSLSQVVSSLIGFTLIYGLLAIVDISLLVKYARQGPEPLPAARRVFSNKEA